MKTAERDQKIQETHQALLGIPGTEDNGLVGDVKEMKRDIKEHAREIIEIKTKQEERSTPSKKSLAGISAVVVGLIVTGWKAFNG